MTDTEAVLRAVLLDPDDELARLAYADSLEELGDPDGHAALIAAMIAGRDHRQALLHHGQAFARRFAAGRPWKTGLRMLKFMRAGAAFSAECQFSFHKGFVRHCVASPSWWAGHGPDLCAAHPVRSLVVSKSADNLTWVDVTRGGIPSNPQSALGMPSRRAADAWQWSGEAISRFLLGAWPAPGEVAATLDMLQHVISTCTNRFYTSAESAGRALYLACLNWARLAVPLPPLGSMATAV